MGLKQGWQQGLKPLQQEKELEQVFGGGGGPETKDEDGIRWKEKAWCSEPTQDLNVVASTSAL